ncbi:MAG TPA: tRNA pseudouridine(55) synthase TruB [Bryobacteraceae bacterium]|nr:tRNA pseudouridine(55) synthase TruB [Bryobacteraceae bacterium]
MHGVLVIDKPAGLTSHDVVNRVRRIAQTRKVGHLGTLDPLATGVLPLVVGRATRLAQFFNASRKTYDALVEFGYSTDTYDCEGKATSEYREPAFDRALLEEKLSAFRGKFLQTPPPVSAKKIAGTPSYKLARQNVPVSLKPVEVEIQWQLHEFSGKLARLSMECSAGTYVRSVAHDVGQLLGCGAFVRSLRRTISGEFTISQASTLEQLQELARSGRIEDVLIPAAKLLPHFPGALIDASTEANIRQGKDFRLSPFHSNPEAPFIKAISHSGDLVAIGAARLPHLYHPVLVL